jgi:hypothetical protein
LTPNYHHPPRFLVHRRTDAIKRASLTSWKYVNLHGAYSFLEIGDGADLQGVVNLLVASRGKGARAAGLRVFYGKN